MANLLLVRRLEVVSANWKKTTTQKGAEKAVLETLMKYSLDIMIAHILNYFCCNSKVCMEFLSDDDYQLNNTVRIIFAKIYKFLGVIADIKLHLEMLFHTFRRAGTTHKSLQ